MDINPRIKHKEEQYYVAITTKVLRRNIPEVLPPLIPKITNWLKAKTIEPKGPPFFHYLQMEGEQLEVEVGIPIGENISGDENISVRKFPSGNYAEATHMGNYSELYKFHEQLHKWQREKGIETIGNCIEYYPIDPTLEPDPQKWQTDVVIRVKEN